MRLIIVIFIYVMFSCVNKCILVYSYLRYLFLDIKEESILQHALCEPHQRKTNTRKETFAFSGASFSVWLGSSLLAR